MTYTFRYTPQAQADMDLVWDGVLAASADPDLSDRYIMDFLECIEAKREFPASGNPVYHAGLFTGYYRVVYKAYSAFYRIKDDKIEILRILPNKQDYMTMLFGDQE